MFEMIEIYIPNSCYLFRHVHIYTFIYQMKRGGGGGGGRRRGKVYYVLLPMPCNLSTSKTWYWFIY